MGRYQYVVLTAPVEGREDEFNDWYTNVHNPEILQVPGIKSARRYRLVPRLEPNPKSLQHRYLALYEIESDDVEAALGELKRRSRSGEHQPSSAIDHSLSSSTLYELMPEEEAP